MQDPKQGGIWQVRIVQKLFTHKWLLVQQAAPITGVYHKVNRNKQEVWWNGSEDDGGSPKEK